MTVLFSAQFLSQCEVTLAHVTTSEHVQESQQAKFVVQRKVLRELESLCLCSTDLRSSKIRTPVPFAVK